MRIDNKRRENEQKMQVSLTTDLKSSIKDMMSGGLRQNKQDEKPKDSIEKVDTKHLSLSNDTYAMAFKGMHRETVEKLLNLDEKVRIDAFYSAVMVFVIQLLMVTFVMSTILSPTAGFLICFPDSVFSLGSRFICTILMHLIVEFDIRQGIQMLKYVSNHREDFINPKIAFSIGIMQCFGGLAAEFLCIVYLTSITKCMDTVTKFMALASISKVDDWYSAALTSDYPLKKKASLPFKNTRSNLAQREDQGHKNCMFYVTRTIYKIIRLFYASYIFYFMPFTCVIIPYFFMDNECYP